MAVNKNKITAQAQKYTAKGQFEKAIAEYRKILRVDQSDIRTWLKMGDLYTRMGSRKEATETYLKVAEYYRKNDFHLKAVAVYRQVIKLDPTLLEVYEMLADAYLSLGLSSDALIQLEQLADMFQRAGNAERMLSVLERMADVDPQNISTRLRIAEQYSKEGQGENAVKNFSLACEQLLEQGRTDDYLKVAERLLFHDTGRVDVALEAAGLYLEKGEAKRALAKLQLCFSKDPHNIQTLELLAQAFHGLEQPDKAVSVYTEIASILEERGETDHRRRILQKILDMDPENEDARQHLLGGKQASPAPVEDDLPSPAAAVSEPPVEMTSQDIEHMSEEGDEAERSEKLLSEAEVLLKYGLVDRAVEHINKIFEFDYFNLDARERLKDVYMEAGDQDAVEQLFILAEGFMEEQPEGSVYFLHQILGIVPRHRKAHIMLKEIGGVIPEGVPSLQEIDAADESSKQEAEEFSVQEELLVDEGSEEEDFGEADLNLSEDSVHEKFLPIDDKAIGADEAAEEVELGDGVLPSLEDVPYVVGENEFSETDIDGSGLIDVGDEDHDTVSELDQDLESNLEPVLDGDSTEELEDSGILDLDDTDIISGPEAVGDLLSTDDNLLVEDLGELEPDEPEGVRVEQVPEKPLPPPPAPKTPAPNAPAPVRPGKVAPPPPPPPPPSSAPGQAADISEELDEIEFFASQGLDDEARGILEGLLKEHGDHPKVKEYKAQLMDDEPPVHSESGLDLEALSEDLDLAEFTNDEVVNEIDEVFSQFKAGVEKQISQSDYATHYDLGVAYKEMGLYEDAISEFEIASGDPARAATSKTMIGICFVGLGRFEEAASTFKGGLELPDLTEAQRLALKYELGKAHEAGDDKEKAVAIYNEILNSDPGFADVLDRIDALS